MGIAVLMVVGAALLWWIVLALSGWFHETQQQRAERTFKVIRDKYGVRRVVMEGEKKKEAEIGAYQVKCFGFPRPNCD